MLLVIRLDPGAKAFRRLQAFFLGQPTFDGRLRLAGRHARLGYAIQEPEARDQAFERSVPVPVLGSRIGGDHPHPGRQVPQANRRVRHIPMLTARPGGPKGLDHHFAFQTGAVGAVGRAGRL